MWTMRTLSRIGAAALACLVVSCSRNGPEVPMPTSGASLEGQVLYGENPVANAMVIVASPAGGSTGGSQAFSDDDGYYKIDNVPTGPVVIAVNTDASKAMMGRSMAGTNPLEKKGKKATAPKVTEVPKPYHSPSTSKLTYDVQRGVNKHDVKIPR